MLSRRLYSAAAVGVGVSVAVVGFIGIAAGASSARPCRGAQLSATMTVIPGSAGAGNIGYRLNLRNHGATPCRLGNHPGLQLLGATGKKLPTHVSRLGRSGTVTITPRHTKIARLRFSPDIPGPGEPIRGACEPKAHRVRVSLSTPASGTSVGPVKPPTSVCEHGSIQEQPLS